MLLNGRSLSRAISCLTVALTVAVFGGRADAFITACHQSISSRALAQTAWPMGATPPPLTGDYPGLLKELPIGVDADVQNFWAMSALIGNLFTDIGSSDIQDLVDVAENAARPDLQREHCLRGIDDDGEPGNQQALAACKAFIEEQLAQALGDGDAPDVDATESVRLHLIFRGDADVPLDRFGFHLGRATHALQDGFSHTFRSDDHRLVKTVLNWVEWIHNGYDEARDGFRHLYQLDTCDQTDPTGMQRWATAQQATAELTAAIADDTGGRAGRLARASAVVDSWFGVQPGCDKSNQWCDAPERLQTAGPGGCALAGDSTGAGDWTAVGGLMVAGALARRLPKRRQRRTEPNMNAKPGRNTITATLLAVGLTMVAAAGRAQANADEKPNSNDKSNGDGRGDGDGDGRAEVKGGVIAKATSTEQEQLAARRFGIVAKGGIAIDKAGYDLGVGIRYDLGKKVTVGLDGEYNPWFSIETGKSVQGATNFYGVGIFRLDVRDYLEVRLTLAAGISILNFDTWAAKKGSLGPYFAVSPLGVAIRMGGHLRFIIDPAEIVIPIPQTTGIPLAYRQHRVSLALQANF